MERLDILKGQMGVTAIASMPSWTIGPLAHNAISLPTGFFDVRYNPSPIEVSLGGIVGGWISGYELCRIGNRIFIGNANNRVVVEPFNGAIGSVGMLPVGTDDPMPPASNLQFVGHQA